MIFNFLLNFNIKTGKRPKERGKRPQVRGKRPKELGERPKDGGKRPQKPINKLKKLKHGNTKIFKSPQWSTSGRYPETPHKRPEDIQERFGQAPKHFPGHPARLFAPPLAAALHPVGYFQRAKAQFLFGHCRPTAPGIHELCTARYQQG